MLTDQFSSSLAGKHDVEDDVGEEDDTGDDVNQDMAGNEESIVMVHGKVAGAGDVSFGIIAYEVVWKDLVRVVLGQDRQLLHVDVNHVQDCKDGATADKDLADYLGDQYFEDVDPAVFIPTIFHTHSKRIRFAGVFVAILKSTSLLDQFFFVQGCQAYL